MALGRGFALFVLIINFVLTVVSFGLAAALIAGYSITDTEENKLKDVKVNSATGFFMMAGAVISIILQIISFCVLTRIRKKGWAMFSALSFFSVAIFLLVAGILVAVQAHDQKGEEYSKFVSTAIGATVVFFLVLGMNVLTGLVFCCLRRKIGDKSNQQQEPRLWEELQGY